MHVLQWIAIQSDDKDMALRTVQENLQTMLGDYEAPTNTWFDWFVAGGGRWNVGEDDSHSEAYVEGKTNLVLSAKEQPDEFDERVLQSMESRKAEFEGYAKDIDVSIIDKVISQYNPREFDFGLFSSIYPIKKLLDMAYGQWDFNSYFYDMENDSTTPKYLFEAIDKDPENWYLVPVDFHF
jgi:hypothetical protein